MEQFDILPQRIQDHLRTITATSGLPDGDESLEMITRNWLEKRRLYQEQADALDMQQLDSFSMDDGRAVMLLTYSGSLIGLESNREGKGPGGRRFEYASIKLRHDVPDVIYAKGVQLQSNLKLDEVAQFAGSPVARSSEILMVTSFADDVKPDEQDKRLREAMLFLTNGFAKINRTLTLVSGDLDHFTMQNIVRYIASRTDLTQAQTREIIDDYLSMVEAGMMMGERVPLGRLGSLSLHQRPARKARMGRNPATGEEIMISAKPAVMIPHFSFFGRVKKRAERVPVQEELDEE